MAQLLERSIMRGSKEFDRSFLLVFVSILCYTFAMASYI